MSDIIATIEAAIDQKYRLERQNGDWLIPQKPAPIRARSAHLHSTGFSLDCPKRPLAFFSARPPAHLDKMCDAMIATLDNQKLHLFAVEVKTSRKQKNNSGRQLANGGHFWRWLAALCREHGYLREEPVYIAVLVWQPRKQVRKGATVHRGANGIDKGSQQGFDAAFQVKNQTLFRLSDLIAGTG